MCPHYVHAKDSAVVDLNSLICRRVFCQSERACPHWRRTDDEEDSKVSASSAFHPSPSPMEMIDQINFVKINMITRNKVDLILHRRKILPTSSIKFPFKT